MVLAISRGWQPKAWAASSTVALEWDKTRTRSPRPRVSK